MRRSGGLTPDERAHYDEHGFVRLAGFTDAEVCQRMLDRAIALARRDGSASVAPLPGGALGGFVLPEANLSATAAPAEDKVSKIFGLHTDDVFGEVACDPALTDVVADIVGPAVDCFLSQFVFKSPGAWGQPWHQDSYYFSFDPARPVVGVSLAVTEATTGNGCLHVVPGSQRDDVHDHVPDRRPGANYGYVEITDCDTSTAEAMPMQAGDLLVFDSHLVHRSSDNTTTSRRAAMTYHFVATGTVDRAPNAVHHAVSVR